MGSSSQGPPLLPPACFADGDLPLDMEASELLSDTFEVLSSKEIRLQALRPRADREQLGEEEELAPVRAALQESQKKLLSQASARLPRWGRCSRGGGAAPGGPGSPEAGALLPRRGRFSRRPRLPRGGGAAPGGPGSPEPPPASPEHPPCQGSSLPAPVAPVARVCLALVLCVWTLYPLTVSLVSGLEASCHLLGKVSMPTCGLAHTPLLCSPLALVSKGPRFRLRGLSLPSLPCAACPTSPPDTHPALPLHSRAPSRPLTPCQPHVVTHSLVWK